MATDIITKQAREIKLLSDELLAKSSELEMLKSQLEKANTQLEHVYTIDSIHGVSRLPPPDLEVICMRIKRAIRPFFSENICQVITAIVDNERANI
jgi:hypothetical protein